MQYDKSLAEYGIEVASHMTHKRLARITHRCHPRLYTYDYP